MSKKNKIIFMVFVILSLGVFVGYQYIYKEHRDISSEEAKFEMAIVVGYDVIMITASYMLFDFIWKD